VRAQVPELAVTTSLRWRCHPALCAVATLTALGMAVAAGVVMAVAVPWPDRLVASGCMLLGSGLAYALSVRPLVEIDDQEVRVVAPVGSTRFPTHELTGASGGRFLTLHRVTGEDVRVFAVQDANVSLLRGRAGRADHAADAVNEWLRRRASSE
jgi:hypothetical protein